MKMEQIEAGYESRRKLGAIISNLKIQEKISIIFLLSDKPHIGLKTMEILLSSSSLQMQNKHFLKWILEQPILKNWSHNNDWIEKFAELLTILQNYKLGTILGYDKDELVNKFQPKNNLISHHVSIIRKTLYNMCDELTDDNSKELIRLVENENGISELDDKMENYLEYKILLWNSKKIINLNEDNNFNLSLLLKHFKLKKLLDEIDINIQKMKLQHSIKMKLSNETHFYDIIDQDNLGFCVIINEKNFPANSDFGRRLGTEKDVERLTEVFTAFGFQVKNHTDVIYNEFMELLDYYRKHIMENHSMFVLVILSHGSKNVIYTSDLVSVSMDDIEMKFQAKECPNLIGKPKIFIVQSCQGTRWQNEKEKAVPNIETDSTSSELISNKSDDAVAAAPEKADSIIAWSTVTGYASFRDPVNGSWYIQELCNELWKFGGVSALQEILMLVNKKLRDKVYDGQCMVPSLLSSTQGQVKFPAVEKDINKGRKLMVERLVFEKYFKEFLSSLRHDL